MPNELKEKRIAFLATDMVELTEPWEAVELAGGAPELVSLAAGEIPGVEDFAEARHEHQRGLVNAGTTPA